MIVILLLLVAVGVVAYLWHRREKRLAAERLEFYMNMAHEVRTPLTLIMVPLKELDKENLSEQGRRYLEIAQRTTEDICDLVSNVLASERDGRGTDTLQVGQYDIDEMMDHWLEPFRPMAEQKLVSLTYQPAPNFSTVWIDKKRVGTIVHNLIANALRYTDAGGEVTITTLHENDRWGFTVADNGIGIPEGEKEHLFDRFFVASNGLQSEQRTGIGLSMVHRLVRMHKGKIKFESQLDQGTTFTVLFPIGYKYYAKYFEQQTAKPQSPTIDAHPIATKERYKVVVVEDNAELRDLLEATLVGNYTIVTAENGKVGWETILQHNPDLIISDVMMPVMNGDELCRMVKEHIETSHIPVMLLTAIDEPMHQVIGFNNLADSYLAKPFDRDLLIANINTLIANREILKQKFAAGTVRESGDLHPLKVSPLDIAFMQKVNSIIEHHLTDGDFNVERLAADMNMSRSALFKKMKNLTDQAPHDVIQQVRLNKAAELLAQGSAVTDAAYQTGFNDAKYFSKVFKLHFGSSPKEYKKTME